jgi:hypothetical protein
MPLAIKLKRVNHTLCGWGTGCPLILLYMIWLWTGDDYSVLLFNANLELSFINLSLGV